MTTVNVEKGWIITEGYTDVAREGSDNNDLLPIANSLREAFRRREGGRMGSE